MSERPKTNRPLPLRILALAAWTAASAAWLAAPAVRAQEAAARGFPTDDALATAIAVEEVERDPARALEAYREVAEDEATPDAVRRHAWLRLAQVAGRLGRDAERTEALTRAARGEDAVAARARELLGAPSPDSERWKLLAQRAEERIERGLGGAHQDLVWIGRPAVEPLIRALESGAHWHAYRLLLRIGGPRARDWMLQRIAAGEELRPMVAALSDQASYPIDEGMQDVVLALCRGPLAHDAVRAVRDADVLDLAQWLAIDAEDPETRIRLLDQVWSAWRTERTPERAARIAAYLAPILEAAEPASARRAFGLLAGVALSSHDGRMLLARWCGRAPDRISLEDGVDGTPRADDREVDAELAALVEGCDRVGDVSEACSKVALSLVEQHRDRLTRRHLDALLRLVELGIPVPLDPAGAADLDRVVAAIPGWDGFVAASGYLSRYDLPETFYARLGVDGGRWQTLRRLVLGGDETAGKILVALARTGHPDFGPRLEDALRGCAQQGGFDSSGAAGAGWLAEAAFHYHLRRRDEVSLGLLADALALDTSGVDRIRTRAVTALAADRPDDVVALLRIGLVRGRADLDRLCRTSDEPTTDLAAYPVPRAGYVELWLRLLRGPLAGTEQVAVLFRASSRSEVQSTRTGPARLAVVEPALLDELIAVWGDPARRPDGEAYFRLFQYRARAGDTMTPAQREAVDALHAEAVRTGLRPASELLERVFEESTTPDAAPPIPTAVVESALDRLAESGTLGALLERGVRVPPSALRAGLAQADGGLRDDMLYVLRPTDGPADAETVDVVVDYARTLLSAPTPDETDLLACFRTFEVFQDPAAVPVLLQGMRSPSKVVRERARAALEALSFYRENARAWRDAAEGTPDLRPARTAAELVAQAGPNAPRDQRLLAIRSLGRLGEPTALAALVRWTRDDDEAVAAAARAAVEAIVGRD